MDFTREEMRREVAEATELTNAAVVAEADMMEQQEMDAFAEAPAVQETAEIAEQQEMDEGAKLGYSSDYYEHRMETARANGNKIAYNNARKDWAKAKVREST